MGKIRIEIHLSQSDVDLLDKMAEKNGRSRKNFCENQIKIAIHGEPDLPKQAPQRATREMSEFSKKRLRSKQGLKD